MMMYFQAGFATRFGRLAALGAGLGLTLGLVACSSGGSSGGSTNPGFEVRSAEYTVNEPLGSVSFAGGATLNLNLAVGSGAFRSFGSDSSIFYTVTDRGPTIPCSDTAEVIGVSNFCPGSGSVFALPEYTPQILQWQLVNNGNQQSLELVDRIPLRDQFLNPASGLPNDLTVATTENAYDSNGASLGFNANGINPKALVQLDDGKFWVADEYGPSLLLVSATGEVLQRQVPAGMAGDLAFSTFEIREDVLPSILTKRKFGRGIEALALSPENDFLYFVMQSPLSLPDEAAGAASRIVRIGKISLNDDGTPNALEGMYAYRLDSPDQFGFKFNGSGDFDGDDYVAQNTITINEAVAYSQDDLVLVEQANTVSKLYRVSLSNAVSILGSQYDGTGASPSLEQQVAEPDYPFVVKQLVYDSLSYSNPSNVSAPGANFEGLALLNANFAALTNNNEYGQRGEAAKIRVLPLGGLLVGQPTPVAPRFDFADSGVVQVGAFDSGAADDVASDSAGVRMFVANNANGSIDVFSMADPLSPSLTSQIDVADATAGLGISAGRIGAIETGQGMLVVTVANANPQQNGAVAFFDLTDLSLLANYEVGATPQKILFERVALRLYVANEGVPSDDYSVDPEGSLTVVDFTDGVENAELTTIGFTDFNVGGSRASELPDGVLITGPGASVAQDLEPEDMTLGNRDETLFVSLQENNAVAVIDTEAMTVTSIVALEQKDFGTVVSGLDSVNDGSVNIVARPGVVGLNQPQGIAAYGFKNKDIFVTANEGAPRTYTGFNEVLSASQLNGSTGPNIDTANPSRSDAALANELGGLQVSRVTGDTDGDGDIDNISAFGGRSLAVWNSQGQKLFDTGDDIAQITQAYLGSNFNNRDAGSVASGAKPAAISILAGTSRIFAAVTLNATGGIIIYDVSSPYGVQFSQFINNRSFSSDPQLDSGDIGPDNMTTFNTNSATYLLVANRRSGSVRILQLSSSNSDS